MVFAASRLVVGVVCLLIPSFSVFRDVWSPGTIWLGSGVVTNQILSAGHGRGSAVFRFAGSKGGAAS